MPASAVDEVGVVLVKNPDLFGYLINRYVLWVGDETDPSLGKGPHVDDLEAGVCGVPGDEFDGLFGW